MVARLRVPVLAPAVALGLSLLAGSASAQAVDMDRFDGRWFEIVRSPNDLQKDCRRAQIDFNPQARANRYGVVVTCTRRVDGVSETLRANARVTDPGTNRTFRFTLTGLLSFGGLAGQTYRVQAHADDYSWAILSLPNRSDWWIWHRNQSPSPAVRADLIRRAAALGLPTGQVIQTGQ
ncbi:lipocalin family protein [Brevundimonas sp. M20]|uniref:lipocalin family protein n=1 Tax=Brevundimonas sp. M20 TaxID=2591463 RepID=UPI001F0D3248|nr:lipocalin family protein [Brevundimonas sp. M20]